MAQNSKDVLFKSKVNNYISEKVSQSGAVPLFTVTNNSGIHNISKFNGDVTMTLVSTDYVFTPTRGDAVSVLASSVSSIAVDFITLNAESTLLDAKSLVGNSIVNLGSFPISADITDINPAVLMVDIDGNTSGEPLILYSFLIGYPSAGRIISIASGEVMLNVGLEITSDTSIVVQENATFILEASQAEGAAISGEGNSVILGIYGDYSISVNTQGTNHITGGAGADTIELGSGTDTLYYGLGDNDSHSDSLISGYDTIKNFKVGTDKISLLGAFGNSISLPSSLTRFADIAGASIASEQDLIDVLTSTNFAALGANEAGMAVVTSGTYAGAYLYINDETAELSENSDLFIKMLNIADLDAVGTLNVSDYFVEAEEFLEVTIENGVVHFAGTANGNILISISGSTATFTKGSVTAETIVDLGDIERIHLDSWQTIVGSAADLDGIIVSGSGNVNVSGSTGDQTLYILTEGTNSITAGTGSDTIWLGDVYANTKTDTIVIASGDSTVGAPDKIYLFELDKDKLDLPLISIASDATLGTGSSDEDETVGTVTIGQMSIANGIVTFQAADDDTAVSIESADALTAAINYLSSQFADGETVAFVYDIDSTQGTYIFQDGATENILVNLIGTTVTDLSAILI